MSGVKLLNVLRADVELAALVDSRILLAPANQGTKTPFVTYEFIADDPIKDLSGIATLQRQEWEVSITSDKYSSADAVKALVLRTLNSERAEFNASFQSSDYEYDQDVDFHRHTLTFILTY